MIMHHTTQGLNSFQGPRGAQTCFCTMQLTNIMISSIVGKADSKPGSYARRGQVGGNSNESHEDDRHCQTLIMVDVQPERKVIRRFVSDHIHENIAPADHAWRLFQPTAAVIVLVGNACAQDCSGRLHLPIPERVCGNECIAEIEVLCSRPTEGA